MKHASFADLGVSEVVVGELAKRGIESPFPVQQLVIPDVLAGRDVLAQSPTGSGKTLAFGVPLVERLRDSDPRPSALILAPTRELALQIVDDLRPLAHARALSIAAVYGGAGRSCRPWRCGRPRPRAWPRTEASGARRRSSSRGDRQPGGSPCRASGRRLRQDVVSGEHVGDHELLYGEGRGETARAQLGHDDLGHAEVGESCMLHVLMLLLATVRPPLQMEIRLTPSALQSANKDKEPHGRLRRP